MSYTPGPWELCVGHTAYYPLMVRSAYNNHEVVSFHTWSEDKEANARLIAAAPELLEALQEVIAISDRKHDAWDRAKAAIAKAKGESK